MATFGAQFSSVAGPHFPGAFIDLTILEDAQQQFESQDPRRAMEAVRTLRDGVSIARQHCSSHDEWKRVIEDRLRAHRALDALYEDPFIGRAYRKPRGYAGDAVMLDFIYRHPANQAYLEATTPRGRASLGISTNTPAPRAVRNRARMLAAEIDELCERRPGAAILSMACGHLREGLLSRAVQERAFGRFVALDQDVESLAVTRADVGPLGVEAREGSVKDLIAHGARLGQFDFVYAAGLYDYLNDKVAARLLETLFAMLKEGGKLWIANFLPDIADRAFMEAFMDWWLVYRTPQQMLDLAAVLPAGACSSRRTFVDPEANIVFLEVCR